MEDEKQMERFAEIQKTIQAIVVKDEIKQKDSGNGRTLSYLPWAAAWNIVLKVAPDANYEVIRFGDEQLPYQKSELGYMVWTAVTICGVRKTMWLPVMDSHNVAMMEKPRLIKTKKGEYTVQQADMNDINKAIMRCLVKNLAMFGLGITIYDGEDMPDIDDEIIAKQKERILCEHCGKPIVDYGPYTAEKIMSTSYKKFGAKLCYSCSVTMSKKNENDTKGE